MYYVGGGFKHMKKAYSFRLSEGAMGVIRGEAKRRGVSEAAVIEGMVMGGFSPDYVPSSEEIGALKKSVVKEKGVVKPLAEQRAGRPNFLK